MSLNHILVNGSGPRLNLRCENLNAITMNSGFLEANNVWCKRTLAVSDPAFGQIGTSVPSLTPNLATYELKSLFDSTGTIIRYFLNLKGSLLVGSLLTNSTFATSYALPAAVTTDEFRNVLVSSFQIASAIATDVPTNQVCPLTITFVGNVFRAEGEWRGTNATAVIINYDVTVELVNNA